MKKSIAFLGALLFGSITFGQVTKNDDTNKSSSRKVSPEDIKKFPDDSESSTTIEGIKGKKVDEASKMHIKYTASEKQSSNATTTTKLGGEVIQKGRGNENSAVTEKQHYTIKLSNADKKTTTVATEKTGSGESAIQKKHISNVKWTPGKASVGNETKESVPNQSAKSTDMFLKIGDIKGEKEGIVSPPTSTKSSDIFLKIGDIKGEKE